MYRKCISSLRRQGGGSQVKFLILMILMIYEANFMGFQILLTKFQNFASFAQTRPYCRGRQDPFWCHFGALGGLFDIKSRKFGTFKYYYGPKSNEYVQVNYSTGEIQRILSFSLLNWSYESKYSTPIMLPKAVFQGRRIVPVKWDLKMT